MYQMAWRIEQAVVRGLIDNVKPGRTVGRIWLVNQERPLELELEGNCWRDIAGTCLIFRNPQPDYSLVPPQISHPQVGVVGDMTASRKMRVFTPGSGTENATWQNHLSLEWFDSVNGRVLIETSQFELEFTQRHWQLTDSEEQEQIRRNLEVMRNFMKAFLQREENVDLWSKENADEFDWEKRLQESDRLSDAFQELMEKYGDDDRCHEKISYAIGWADSVEAENELGEPDPIMELESEYLRDELLDDDDTAEWQEDSWDELGEDDEFDPNAHPLQRKAQETASMAIALLADRMDRPGAESRLCSQLMMIAAKLAGTLNAGSEEFDPEPGFILAMLKRCLHWQNDAIAACVELIGRCQNSQEKHALEEIRDAIFDIRAQITELRREFKQN
jgi:hypothetical protein